MNNYKIQILYEVAACGTELEVSGFNVIPNSCLSLRSKTEKMRLQWIESRVTI